MPGPSEYIADSRGADDESLCNDDTVSIMRIEIDTHDRRLSFDLLDNPKTVHASETAEVPGGAKLTFHGLLVRKAFGIPETIEAILTFGGGVASGLVASWLYEKIKGRATSLRIDEIEVRIDKGEIERIIRRTIEKTK